MAAHIVLQQCAIDACLRIYLDIQMLCQFFVVIETSVKHSGSK